MSARPIPCVVAFLVWVAATTHAAQPQGCVYYVTKSEAGNEIITRVPVISHAPDGTEDTHTFASREPAPTEVKQVMYTTPPLKVSVPPTVKDSDMGRTPVAPPVPS